MKTSLKHQKASALITALFIMALIAAAAAAMMLQQQISIVRSQQIINYDRALKIADIVTDWSVNTLTQNLKNSQAPIDTIPLLYPTRKIPGGSYRGILLDAQAKFNLNNLANSSARAGFNNLLKVLFPKNKNTVELTDAISNWVAPQGQYNLSFDDAYRKAGLHYEPPHQLMRNVTELRKVIGISAKIYQTLLPFVTALPTSKAKLNINTAPTADLLTLSARITPEMAKQLLKARPYTSTTQFYATPIAKNFGITQGATVQSQYFLSRALVKLGTQTLLLNSYLYRGAKDNQVVVLWQTQG